MKLKKLAYILPLLACVLSGCNSNSSKENPEFNGEVDLFNFDGWGPGYQTLVLINSFGRVSENYDSQYVKSGTGSALLQPLGNYTTKTDPVIYWPLVSNVYGYNYSDLSYFIKIDADFYNASDSDIPMTIGFISGVTNITTVSLGKGDTFTLKSKEWTHVTYEPNISMLNMYVNLTNARGLYLKFPNANTPDVNLAPKIYVDEIKMTNAKEKRNIVDMFKIKKNEICDFEDEMALNHISVHNIAPEHLSFEIVGETNGIKPSHGTKMLHVKNKGFQGRWVHWSKINFSETYIKKTDLVKLPEAEVEAGKWGIRYEILYHDGENKIFEGSFFPEFASSSGVLEYIPRHEHKHDRWISVTVPFNIRENIYGGSYMIPTECIVNCVSFGWTVGNEEYDVDAYIDNIRIVSLA